MDTLSNDQGSAMLKYQDLYVGARSLWSLLSYEFLMLTLSGMPGALGLWLRRRLYGTILGQVGRGTAIAPYVTLRCPGRISLGEHVFVDSHAVLDAKGAGACLRLGDGVLVGHSTVLSCASAAMIIGDDVSIGPHCTLRAGLCPIELGSQVTIGSHAAIVSGNPGYERLDIPMKSQVGSTEGIGVGDDVWIGIGARIIDGVRVGQGAVIGAGAVVIADVPEYAVVAGVPARVIRDRRQRLVS